MTIQLTCTNSAFLNVLSIIIKCNQCHLHDFHVSCCTRVIIVEPKIHFFFENKVFNKYLYVKRLPVSFFAQPFFLPYQKNEVQTGLILDEKVVIHTHGMHLLSRHSLQILCSSRT